MLKDEEKAVIFTHLPYRARDEQGEVATFDAATAFQLQQRVRKNYTAYLRCRNIGIVYVYVDTGTDMLLRNISVSEVGHELDGIEEDLLSRRRVRFQLDELEFEQKTRDVLRSAVDDAINDLISGDDAFDPLSSPSFQFIGFPHLLSLFNELLSHDPAGGLLKDLAGRVDREEKLTFTYDAPKFIEAVIRIGFAARGNPVLRVDEDVEVNEASIEVLRKKALVCLRRHTEKFFFSGTYAGDPEDLNQFAIRTHFLPNLSSDGANLDARGKMFLRDLGELGAMQLSPAGVEPSNAMKAVLEARNQRGGEPTSARQAGQVISGAGLFMTPNAVMELPPFMNFTEFTVWIDDHLKRRLHEAVGHIDNKDPEQLERFDDARFFQARSPRPEGWTKKYFERVLRGILVHYMVVLPDGLPGPLAQIVREFKKSPAQKKFLKIGRLSNSALWEGFSVKVRKEFEVCAKGALEDTLRVWEKADESYGCPLLGEWTRALKADEEDQGRVVRSTVLDVLGYVRLLTRWGDYVRAIQHLSKHGTYWLYRPF